MECKQCGQELWDFKDYGKICEVHQCPVCGWKFEVFIDTSYDEEDGEYDMFYVEEAEGTEEC